MVYEENQEYVNKPGRTNRRKKVFKNIFFWLKFLLITALVTVTLVLLALSQVFNINTIKVTGVSHYSENEIVEISGVVKGENGFKSIGSNFRNIYELRYGNAEQAIIERCSYVKEAVVRYIIPGTVSIEIEERNAACMVPYLGTSLVIDREGYVVDVVKSMNNYELPHIKGMSFNYYELGKFLKVDNAKSIEKVLMVIDEMRKVDNNESLNMYELMEWIDVSDLRNIYIHIDSRLTVNLGDLHELNYRLRTLNQIFSRNLKKNDKGLLDFTAGEYPVFIPDNNAF